MDAFRFDSLTRSLVTHGSRRRALAAALGGALGLLGLRDPDDAAAAKSCTCKPKCGECEKCKKGDCDRKNGKKVCKKGKCQPKSNGTPCTVPAGGSCHNGACVACPATCPVCQACVNGQTCTPLANDPACETNACKACQGGACVNAPVGKPCDGTGKCNGSGTCAPAPNCVPRGGFCGEGEPRPCCSATCTLDPGDPTGSCAQSAQGEPCITDDDCNSGMILLSVCGNDFTC